MTGLLGLVVGLLAAAPLGAEAVRIAPTHGPSPGSPKSTEIMHARYFSPNLGRFLSVDPVGGEVGSSQSWNRYSYVQNNPLSKVDPDGRADQFILDYYYATKDLSPEGKEAFDKGLETALAVGLGSLVVGALAFEAAPAVLPALATPQAQQAMQTVGEVLNPNPGTLGGAADAVGSAARGGRAVIGKLDDIAAGKLRPGENNLLKHLEGDLGTPQANWARNSSVLRAEMNKGLPIRDASVDPITGERLSNTGFLRAERNLLENHGWTYDPATTLWSPPPVP